MNNIVSVEAGTMDGSSPETQGIKGVREKVDWWLDNMQVHSFAAHGLALFVRTVRKG